MSFQFANARAALFGQRHLFSDPTASDVIAFVRGANTHGNTCLLCGGTSGYGCVGLSAYHYRTNGVWQVTPETLRKLSAELDLLNSYRYESMLALALGVPAISVLVDFTVNEVHQPVTRITWKGDKRPTKPGFFADLLPTCEVELHRLPSGSDLTSVVEIIERSLLGVKLPMLASISDPSVFRPAIDALGPWREFKLSETTIEDWCKQLLNGGAPPPDVTEDDCLLALSSEFAAVRAMAFELVGLIPPAAVPVAPPIVA